ncbi:50S ribosomal protein L4 [Thalassoglobus polymorphus]|uniref:Large ribosomal subunit protein uL4 n=1 Tax=Thalassoglobus polymorphus TaxID=2527994 RepID=A0A517QI04_9PLAN|nr:50S ribosomal protein L4 [Thalassoglobus polymorphus]QDT31268.1 50S ribosomal protein L4 [Thalassoglobus polymorphus]
MSDDTKITAPIRDLAGGEVGTYEFDGNDLADRVSKQLLHDVVVMYDANRRQGTFKTKTRSEVSGRKKKMFRQKGTGNARMGTKQSPVRVGGGHAFAKRPRDFSYRLPKKAVRLATRMAMLSKFQDGEAIVLNELQLSESRTKPVFNMLNAVGLGGDSVLLVIPEYDLDIWRSARNIPNLWVAPLNELNAYSLLHQKHLLITKEAIDLARQGSFASTAESAAVG